MMDNSEQNQSPEIIGNKQDTAETAETTPPPSEETPEVPVIPAVDKGRFSIDEIGQVLWQENSSNPLPGDVVANLTKGEDALSPRITPIACHYPDTEALKQDIENWLKTHINEILGSIETFAAALGVAAPLQDIAGSLKYHLGVVDRYKIERSLSALDPDMRRILRQHKIRSGPLMIFYQEQLKPAPLKLKSILWGIYNERELPLKRPKDGIVSEVIEDERIDYAYYKMLGYPVYAGRAIRIDMLDRVVTDIYDNAKEGSFRAQHKYAEWLGCSLDALYAVLEALGHYKVEDPAAQKVGEEETATKESVKSQDTSQDTSQDNIKADISETATVETTVTEPPVSQNENVEVEEVKSEEKQAVEKPLLALFKLKKGKLSTPPKRPAAAKGKNKSSSFSKKDDKDKGRFKSKPKGKGKNAKTPHKDKGPRVITIESKTQNDDDNPFAVLKNLNLK